MTKISQWVTTMASETPGSTVSLVGQGSFLDKPSLHMVGYMGKNTNAFKTPPDGCCPVCKSKGKSQALKTYRLNFTESIFLCSNPQCIFPLGYTPLDNIIANTVDLKKSSSPSKTKKRNISELSPAPLPSEKRMKKDLPVLGECLSRNVFSSTQSDQSSFVPVFPALACDVSPLSTSQLYSANDKKIQVQNVSGTANSFSSFPSGLCEKHSPSSVPMGLHNGEVCHQSEALLVDQHMQQERDLPNEVVEIDTLDNDFLHHCGKPETEDPHQLAETGRSLSSKGKEQETLKLNSEIENTVSSNGDKGGMEHPAFNPDDIFSITVTTPPPPLLQCDSLVSQVKENPPKMGSSPAFSIVDDGPDLRNDSVFKSGLPAFCEIVQNSLCEKVEGCLLQDNRPRQQVEDIGAVENASCVEASQNTPTTICKMTASPGVRHNKSDQETNGNIFIELCSPPIALVGAVEESSIVDTVVSPFKNESSEYDGCKIALPSQSLQNMQQVCPTEDSSLDVYELTCTKAAVAQDNSVELIAASWKVCHLSHQKHLGENEEKRQCGTDTPSQLLEPQRLPLNLSKDESLLCVSDTILSSDSIGEYSSNISMANPALPGSNFPGAQKMVQDCRKSSSETPNSVQELLPNCHSEEKSVSALCDNPVSAVSGQANGNSAAESLQENPTSGLLDLVYGCQTNNITKPPDSLDDLQPVCRSDTSSMMCICDTPCTAASVVKDGINVDPDVSSLLDHSLPDLQNLTQDCPKVNCVTSTPSPGIQKAPPMYDHSTLVINGSSCDVTADLDDCDNADTSGPQVSDNHFLDGLMDSCENTVTPNSQINSVLNKEGSSSCDTVITTKDQGTERPPVLSNCDVSVCKSVTKKTFYENTVLPDLLLDIQPEHRMEETLVGAAPTPACHVPVSLSLSDAEPVVHGGLLQEAQDTQYDRSKLNDLTEISSAVTNHSGVHDVSLETSLNTDSLSQDESMDVTDVESKQVSKTPGNRTFKNTQRCLQWRNKHSLCWLDCILSALVQSELLNKFVAKGDNKQLIIHYLLESYKEISSTLAQSTKKIKSKGTSTIEKSLNEVRMYVFDKLKPFLKCELGQKESPVFAFPLLLKQDPEVEKLYVHNYTWNFKCELCGYSYQNRCQKTLTTFTKVVRGWRPLNALHTAPCNKCLDTNQKRSMHLEKLHSVFMVHFVEGLPTNDLEEYSFQFKGHLYEIRTVIRYRHDHFSTWIANDDGTWLESDDLKGLYCRRHQKFRVRAEDIHVVMWERRNTETPGEEDTQLRAAGHENPELNAELPQDHKLYLDASTDTPTQVIPTAGSGDRNTSNPLAGMEGYADDDIITLTLVEIPVDAVGNPVALKPSDTCAAEMEESQVDPPQLAQLKVPNDPLPLPQSKDQRLGTFLSSSPSAKTVSPVEVPQSPVEQNIMTKPAFNMQPNATTTSTPAPQPYSKKKSTVGNWMSSLLNSSLCVANKRNPPIKPCPPLKVTEINGFPKKAQNFDGFQSKCVNKTGSMGSTVLQSKAANPLSFGTPKEKKTFLTPAAPSLLKHGSNGLNVSKLMKDGSSSSEDKIRKLRLKLLKKLKAKKNELATLERMAKIQQSNPSSDQSDALAQGRLNRREQLRGFLQELQDQIDNADNESVCTMSSTTSLCSSPGDAEFFAELFSPPPMDNPANDSQYLEMLADGYGISTDQAQQAYGHDLPMDSSFSQQSTSGSDSCLKTGTPDRSVGEASLDFMSSSTLAMLNEDTEYFPPFDYIF